MKKKADLLKRLDHAELRGTILRRAIQQRMDSMKDKKYTLEQLQQLTLEMEGKDYKALQEIHKKWIGF